MTGKKIAALVGFLVLGLSPSFIDWEQSPEKRKQVIFYYGAALGLLYYGVLSK